MPSRIIDLDGNEVQVQRVSEDVEVPVVDSDTVINTADDLPITPALVNVIVLPYNVFGQYSVYYLYNTSFSPAVAGTVTIRVLDGDGVQLGDPIVLPFDASSDDVRAAIAAEADPFLPVVAPSSEGSDFNNGFSPTAGAGVSWYNTYYALVDGNPAESTGPSIELVSTSGLVDAFAEPVNVIVHLERQGFPVFLPPDDEHIFLAFASNGEESCYIAIPGLEWSNPWLALRDPA